MDAAAEAGSLGCIKFLRERGVAWELSTCLSAAKAKSASCLTFLHENGCPWNTDMCLTTAAEHGSLQSLTYLLKSGVVPTVEAFLTALKNGKAECAKALMEHVSHLEVLHLDAVEGGSLECLELCHVAFPTASLDNARDQALSKGSLECLKYLHQRGVPLSDKHVAVAAFYCHLNILRYLYECGKRLEPSAMSHVLKTSTVDCLIFLRDSGCDFKGLDCTTQAQRCHLPEVLFARNCGCTWHTESLCAFAIAKRSFPCLRYFHQQGCPLPADSCNRAAAQGTVQCLAYGHRNGCQISGDTAFLATCHGSVSCLRYCSEFGAILEARVCSVAAASSAETLCCLKYAHEHGAPWDETTCLAAVASGNLSALKYSHRHGCPWSASTTCKAAECENPALLQYALENHCPLDVPSISSAGARISSACLILLQLWFRQHRTPRSPPADNDKPPPGSH